MRRWLKQSRLSRRTSLNLPASGQRWTRQPSTLFAAFCVVGIIAFIVIVPFLPNYDPYGQDLRSTALPPFSRGDGGTLHILGTDSLGRDLLSRLVVGGRVSLLVAIVAATLSAVLGTFLGLVSGYLGGRTSALIMGIADIQLAIPRILIVIAVVGAVGPSLKNLIILLSVTSWVPYARVVRAKTLSLREREFVLAAQTFGASSRWTVQKHILPNSLGQAVIVASFDLSNMLILESTLSYLGLGLQPPLTSWGLMISDAQTYIVAQPWLSILPGIAILFFVVGTNVLSQAFTSETDARA